VGRDRLTKETVKVAATKADSVRQLKGAPEYDKAKIDHIKTIVASVHQSMDGLHTAVAEMTKIKSHEISPDGKLGGRGYVMTIKDFKDGLSSALNTVSNLMDTLADELTNPNWGLSPEEIQEILSGKASEEVEEDVLEEEPAAEEVADEEVSLEEETPTPAEEELSFEEEAPAEETPAVEEAPSEDPLGDVKEDLDDMAEKLSNDDPEEQSFTPPKLPYEKISIAAGRPDLDPVASQLRAPILFNMFERPTGDKGAES
jgi:hypothetical protein